MHAYAHLARCGRGCRYLANLDDVRWAVAVDDGGVHDAFSSRSDAAVVQREVAVAVVAVVVAVGSTMWQLIDGNCRTDCTVERDDTSRHA